MYTVWIGLAQEWSRDWLLMFSRVVKIGACLSSMLKINVALPNGHAELVTLLPSFMVPDVRTKAERAFGKKYLRLITAKNRVLVDLAKTLLEEPAGRGRRVPYSSGTSTTTGSNIRCLCLVVSWRCNRYLGSCRLLLRQFGSSRSAQDCAAGSSYTCVLCCHLENRSVVTWGRADAGGNSSAVRDQLKGVTQNQAAPHGAFAVILEDGSVITWGCADYDVYLLHMIYTWFNASFASTGLTPDCHTFIYR